MKVPVWFSRLSKAIWMPSRARSDVQMVNDNACPTSHGCGNTYSRPLPHASPSGCQPSTHGRGDTCEAPSFSLTLGILLVSQFLRLLSTVTHSCCSQTCPACPVCQSPIRPACEPSLMSVPTSPGLFFCGTSSGGS